MKILRKKESDIYCREFELTARQKFLLFLGVDDNYFNINNIHNKKRFLNVLMVIELKMNLLRKIRKQKV